MVLKTDWYENLRNVESRGSLIEVKGGLLGCHAARLEHQGQFFTPDSVVQFLWHVLGLDLPMEEDSQASILDNSFGSGRMFQFANPSNHILLGIEQDLELVTLVREAAHRAGFRFNLVHGDLCEYRLRQGPADFGLINPPFSLHWDGPLVEPYPCNSFGRYGPNSGATSHKHALYQALEWCKNVGAVLPRTYAMEVLASCKDDPFLTRLCAVYHLPKNTFHEEGADVLASVLIFGRRHNREPVSVLSLESLTQEVALPDLGWYPSWSLVDQELYLPLQEKDGPAVTLPVTNDKSVRICHHGRKLVLKFNCAIAQARVMNLVYKDHVVSYRSRDFRLADGVKYTGQGKLDLECYLIQDEPEVAFATFLSSIRELGFVPMVDQGIWNYLRKRIDRDNLVRTPLRHVVNLTDGGLSRWLAEQQDLRAVCKKSFKVWDYSGPDVALGEEIAFQRYKGYKGETWKATHAQYIFGLTADQLLERFEFPDFVPLPDDWTVVHEGLEFHYRELFAQRLNLAKKLGLDEWCSWEFQIHDLVEVSLKHGHTIVGWTMGLGKARLSLALCILGQCRHNLIVVEPRLLGEMTDEIHLLGIPDSDWQVIDKPRHLDKLRKINVIAYTRLKASAVKGSKRQTYARKLRRRIGVCICDEAHLLRNRKTDQTQAVWNISPRVRYAMSGTPVANYPRDVLPLIQWVAGDGTAVQPYGHYHPYLQTINLLDLGKAPRGLDIFKDLFCEFAWITNEFAEDLRTGAKREIPRIKDVNAFRELVAPFLKRRVMEEPEVARHVHIPVPITQVLSLPWDTEHLAYYVQVAREFVNWFKKMDQWQRKQVGLIAILAKMQAVYTAANYPQEGVMNLAPYHGLTSKQRHALQTLCQWTQEGHKSILLCHSPSVVELFSRHLGDIPHVKFHGEITIAERIKNLDEKFRQGDTPILLATKGCLQTGYNIHQADRVILYDRSWTPQVESQACARVLRPQQKRQVLLQYLELDGSIDSYQAQMVSFKSASMKSGLDYGADNLDQDFLHIETILGRFVRDFEETQGVKFQEILEERKLYYA